MKARGTLVALLLPLAVSLAACGGDSDSTATDPDAADSSTATDTATASGSGSATPTDSPTATEEPKEPQCADVWVEGQKLPWTYEECFDGDRRVKANGRYCEIGKPLITYRDNWYATPGGPINKTAGPLAQDPDYQKAVRACGG